MSQALINSIAIAVLSATLAFLAAWWWRNRAMRDKKEEKSADERRDEQNTLVKRVKDLETQLASVNQTVLPLNAAFQAVLIKQLTHFHTPELDELMVKLGPPVTLTEEEAERLAWLLEQREQDMNGRIDDSERDAARMLPLVMKRVRAEQIAPEPAAPIVVTVPESALKSAKGAKAKED